MVDWSPPTGPPVAPSALLPPPVPSSDLVARVVESWAEQLVDRSGKNRLLYFKFSARTILRMRAESVGEFTQGKSLRLSAAIGHNEKDRKDGIRVASSLLKTAKTAFEEFGFSTLYVALHMIKWPAPSDRPQPCAPLLLCPVTIEKRDGGSDYEIVVAGDWELNDALRLVLQSTFDLDLPAGPILDAISQGNWAQVADEARTALGRVQGSEVEECLVLSNFVYDDLPVVADLRTGCDRFAQHHLVAALAGSPTAKAAVRSRNQDGSNVNLYEELLPLLVHDSDSSQEEAISLAISGHDLVIDGPPGTGKSRTIANIIAALVANDRSVLFVAEKRAAIDAVAKYLGEVGLDDLFFDLHGGVASPRRIGGQVRAALDLVEQVPLHDFGSLDQDLALRRSQVDERCRALHDRSERFGMSLWDALVVLSGIPDAARIDDAPIPQSHTDALSAATLKSAEDALQTLVELGGLSLFSEGHLLAKAHLARTLSTRDAVVRVLDTLEALITESLPGIRSASISLEAQTGLRAPKTMAECEQHSRLLTDFSHDLRKFKAEIFSTDVAALLRSYAAASNGHVKRLLSTVTSPRYRYARAEIRKLSTKPALRHSAATYESLRHVASTTELWAELSGGRVPTATIEPMESWMTSYGHFVEQARTVEQLLCDDGFGTLSLDQIDRLARAYLAHSDLITRLPTIRERDDYLRGAGFGPLIDRLPQHLPSPSLAAMALRWTWHRMVVRNLLTQPAIAGVSRETLDRLVSDFAAYDRQLVRSASKRVRRRWAEHVDRARNQHPDDYETIRKLGAGKSGIKASMLRRLLVEQPQTLLAVRPCWTMSPVVVAKLLPQVEGLFDVVIFDEASQVKPVHAIPALFRSRRAIVCGDDKQLPPTSFFDLLDDDEDEIDLSTEDLAPMVSMESALDALANSGVPRRTLRWHYRSADERLIAFCNARDDLYARRLITFPGAHLEAPLRHVEVASESAIPHEEIREVVRLVQSHARTNPAASLGVITLGRPHAARIEDAIASARVDDPVLGAFLDADTDEPFFVKSIERVQGDEREAIILSIGLGRGDSGRLANRLAAINIEGGIRRLNVAVTRARSFMTIVTSFSAGEMVEPRFSKPGAKMLRDYIRYASSGGTALPGGSGLSTLNGFELDVARELDAHRIPYQPQWGSSGFAIDFALEDRDHVGRFVLAVECDGRTYHSSPTARERDRLRQQHLERLGWRFHRIWSTEWFRNRAQEVEALVAAYEEALRYRQIDEGPVPPGDDIPPVDDVLVRRGIRPLLGNRASIDAYSLAELESVIAWVKSDGRLRSQQQLIREVASELGFKRLGPKIRGTIEAALVV